MLVESKWERERRIKRDGGDFMTNEDKDTAVDEETQEEVEKEEPEEKSEEETEEEKEEVE